MIKPTDPIALIYMEYVINSMLEDLKQVQLCRDYYEGEQTVFLTDRMEQFLQLHNSDVTFRLNVCKVIITALLDEMVLKGFSTSEKTETKPQADWAAEVYKASHLDELQNNVHEATLRDRETFVIVAWDEEKRQPYFVHNELYVGKDAGGDGDGCYMIYSSERPDIPIAAVKAWEESISLENTTKTRRRRTVYYSDRIERFYYNGGWLEYTEDGKPFPIPLVGADNKPIGLPVISFRNTDDKSEIWEVIPNQDAINKIALDILGIADVSGFPSLFVSGFEPLDSEGDPLKLTPMQMWGTTKNSGEVGVQKIEASDVTPIVNTLMTWIAITANLTGTPVSRFIMTGQIAASETLKEQDRPLQKKADRRRVSFGNSWERVMEIARAMANAYGAAGLDEDVSFVADWKLEYSAEQLRDMMSFGVPQEFLWMKSGMTAEEIEAIKKTDEYRVNLKAKVWAAVGAASAEPVPAETILKDFGYTDEQLAEFDAARMAKIALEQEDVMPDGIMQ